LAHVLAGVAALNTRDVQLPCVVTIVGDRESGIVRHHVVVNAQDGLCVSFDPRHLQHEIGTSTCKFVCNPWIFLGDKARQLKKVIEDATEYLLSINDCPNGAST